MWKQFKSNIFLSIYIVLILFLGAAVRQKMGINIEGDSIFAQTRVFAFPFLLLGYLTHNKRIKFSQSEIFFFWGTILFILFSRFVLGRSAGLSFIINNIYEPILLIAILRKVTSNYLWFMQRLLYVFIILISVIAIYEGITQTIVFASSDGLEWDGMRAHSIHGHPLQNAFLVSVVITAILCSNINRTWRYSLFFIGYIAIFAFNTRSSIMFMSGVLIVNIWRDYFKKNISIVNKLFLLCCLIIFLFTGFALIQEYNLGNRIFDNSLDSSDSSASARWILIDIISRLGLNDIFWGIGSGGDILKRYGLIAIENSFVLMIIKYGLIYTCFFTVCIYYEFKKIRKTTFSFYLFILVAFLLLNTNNVIDSSLPSIPAIALVLFAFKDTKYTMNNIQ